MSNKYMSWFSRLFFFVALILLIVAAWDRVLHAFGYSLSFLPYEPGRLFEFSAILVIFVIAVLLRQIRDAVKGK